MFFFWILVLFNLSTVISQNHSLYQCSGVNIISQSYIAAGFSVNKRTYNYNDINNLKFFPVQGQGDIDLVYTSGISAMVPIDKNNNISMHNHDTTSSSITLDTTSSSTTSDTTSTSTSTSSSVQPSTSSLASSSTNVATNIGTTGGTTWVNTGGTTFQTFTSSSVQPSTTSSPVVNRYACNQKPFYMFYNVAKGYFILNETSNTSFSYNFDNTTSVVWNMDNFGRAVMYICDSNINGYLKPLYMYVSIYGDYQNDKNFDIIYSTTYTADSSTNSTRIKNNGIPLGYIYTSTPPGSSFASVYAYQRDYSTRGFGYMGSRDSILGYYSPQAYWTSNNTLNYSFIPGVNLGYTPFTRNGSLIPDSGSMTKRNIEERQIGNSTDVRLDFQTLLSFTASDVEPFCFYVSNTTQVQVPGVGFTTLSSDSGFQISYTPKYNYCVYGLTFVQTYMSDVGFSHGGEICHCRTALTTTCTSETNWCIDTGHSLCGHQFLSGVATGSDCFYRNADLCTSNYVSSNSISDAFQISGTKSCFQVADFSAFDVPTTTLTVPLDTPIPFKVGQYIINAQGSLNNNFYTGGDIITRKREDPTGRLGTYRVNNFLNGPNEYSRLKGAYVKETPSGWYGDSAEFNAITQFNLISCPDNSFHYEDTVADTNFYGGNSVSISGYFGPKGLATTQFVTALNDKGIFMPQSVNFSYYHTGTTLITLTGDFPNTKFIFKSVGIKSLSCVNNTMASVTGTVMICSIVGEDYGSTILSLFDASNSLLKIDSYRVVKFPASTSITFTIIPFGTTGDNTLSLCGMNSISGKICNYFTLNQTGYISVDNTKPSNSIPKPNPGVSSDLNIIGDVLSLNQKILDWINSNVGLFSGLITIVVVIVVFIVAMVLLYKCGLLSICKRKTIDRLRLKKYKKVEEEEMQSSNLVNNSLYPTNYLPPPPSSPPLARLNSVLDKY